MDLFLHSKLIHHVEKAMATHSSVLAWRIPGTGEPGGLPSMGSHRAGHDCSALAAAAGMHCGVDLGGRSVRLCSSASRTPGGRPSWLQPPAPQFSAALLRPPFLQLWVFENPVKLISSSLQPSLLFCWVNSFQRCCVYERVLQVQSPVWPLDPSWGAACVHVRCIGFLLSSGGSFAFS